ncbi:MAG: MBL fold metallo-hydrolase [Desulfuromonadaceae bacterium]|nr:MBL fold metallo-hydrolase [Desulfuromonadaceae bacterium]
MDYNCFHQVYLDQPKLEGFRNFINAWIYADTSASFVLDPGPLSSIPVLLQALQQYGIERLDYILLTHIHIDHAGGTGELLRHFPDAQVICHPVGIKHMLAPQALWEGSLKVLGKVAMEYGGIVPVPEQSIHYRPVLEDIGITVLQTPGHAAHHLSFMFGDLLMAGEVAGVCLDTPRGVYMRPATPPRFDLDVALESLQRVMTQKPQKMIFAHSTMQDNAMECLRVAEKQLYLWVKGIIEWTEDDAGNGSKDGTEGSVGGKGEERLHAVMYPWLLQHDSIFARIESLPNDIKKRERYFLGNSINGMRGFVPLIDKVRRRAILDRAGAGIYA